MTDTKLLFKDQKINSSSKVGAKPTRHNLLLTKSAILQQQQLCVQGKKLISEEWLNDFFLL